MKKQIMILLSAILMLFLVANISATWTQNLNEGLIGYFNFSEGFGTTTADVTNQQPNATLMGSGVSFTTGKIVNGINFNKTIGSRIKLTPTQTFTETSPYSISLWASTPINIYGGIVYITQSSSLLKGNFFNFGDTGYSIVPQISIVGTNSLMVYAVNNPINLTKWTHYVLTYNGNKLVSGLKLYENGIDISSPWGYSVDDFTGSFVADTITFGSADGNSDINAHLTGNLSEIGIWNRTLNQSEVLQLYNNDLGLTYNLIIPPLPIVIEFNTSLDSPIDNYTSLIPIVLFDCDVNNTADLLNLTLIIDGVRNISIFNTTGNQTNLELIYPVTFENGTSHNWTCEGFSQFYNNTATARTFLISVPTIPIPPIPPTPPAEQGQIYDTLKSSGAGLGILFQILGVVLLPFFIVFFLIMMIVAIGFVIVNVIKNFRANK